MRGDLPRADPGGMVGNVEQVAAFWSEALRNSHDEAATRQAFRRWYEAAPEHADAFARVETARERGLGRVPEDVTRAALSHLLEALAHCHDARWVHRDGWVRPPPIPSPPRCCARRYGTTSSS